MTTTSSTTTTTTSTITTNTVTSTTITTNTTITLSNKIHECKKAVIKKRGAAAKCRLIQYNTKKYGVFSFVSDF